MGASFIVIVILGALTAIGPISTDIYLPSFPTLGTELLANPAEVQRTLAASFLGMALGQAFYGPASDRLGRRLPLALGMGLFALASVGCALAPGIVTLTWLRLLQALGGCAGAVVARAVVRDLAQGPAMVTLMAKLMLVFALAPILGPSLGGLLLNAFGWRAIFWLLAGYGAAMVLAVWLLLPESLPPERRQRGGLVVVLAAYARLLRDRRFMSYALGGTLPMGGMFAYIAGSPFVFMELNGVSASAYGLYFGANAAGIMAMAQLVGHVASRMPAERILLMAQLAALAAGLAMVVATGFGLGGFPALVAGIWCYVAAIGAIMPVATALAMGGQGRAAGAASAVVGVLQFGIGAAVGGLVSAVVSGPGAGLSLALVMAGCAAAALSARAVLGYSKS